MKNQIDTISNRRCLKTYGSQTQLRDHISKCIEQEFCKISNTNPIKKINFNDWYMKIDLPIWTDADFECMNVPVDDGSESHIRSAKEPQRKALYINIPEAVS